MSKHTLWTWQNNRKLAKFKVGFKQICQVQALHKSHEDCSWSFIDTYILVVSTHYLNSEKYELHRRKKLLYFLGVILRPVWNPPYTRGLVISRNVWRVLVENLANLATQGKQGSGKKRRWTRWWEQAELDRKWAFRVVPRPPDRTAAVGVQPVWLILQHQGHHQGACGESHSWGAGQCQSEVFRLVPANPMTTVNHPM